MSKTDSLFNNLSILVVEDSAYMRQLLMTMLRALGIQKLEVAKSGSEGFEKLKSFSPDLILTDAAMEPVDGFTFVEHVRTKGPVDLSTIPVIMISGHREREMIERARDIGVTEYLAKPITPVSLYSRLIEATANPRPFIKSVDFIGPDRRRRDQTFKGPDRRKTAVHPDAEQWEL